MKKCPYCAEEIKDEAVVCRFCGRNVDEKSIKEAVAIKKASSNTRAISVILLVVAAGAFGVGLFFDIFNMIGGYGGGLSQTMLSFYCIVPSLVLSFIFYMISK